MGKRSNFKKNPRDLYKTIEEKSVYPLLPFLYQKDRFVEPCAGSGHLIQHLESIGLECSAAYDIKPLKSKYVIKKCNVLAEKFHIPRKTDYVITNPPWTRDILHSMIITFSDLLPTWLLFDSDWIHTSQSSPFQSRIRKIVSVGRLRWIPGTKMTGKDNCCWYYFGPPKRHNQIKFYGR